MCILNAYLCLADIKLIELKCLKIAVIPFMALYLLCPCIKPLFITVSLFCVKLLLSPQAQLSVLFLVPYTCSASQTFATKFFFVKSSRARTYSLHLSRVQYTAWHIINLFFFFFFSPRKQMDQKKTYLFITKA